MNKKDDPADDQIKKKVDQIHFLATWLPWVVVGAVALTTIIIMTQLLLFN